MEEDRWETHVYMSVPERDSLCADARRYWETFKLGGKMTLKDPERCFGIKQLRPSASIRKGMLLERPGRDGC